MSWLRVVQESMSGPALVLVRQCTCVATLSPGSVWLPHIGIDDSKDSQMCRVLYFLIFGFPGEIPASRDKIPERIERGNPIWAPAPSQGGGNPCPPLVPDLGSRPLTSVDHAVFINPSTSVSSSYGLSFPLNPQTATGSCASPLVTLKSSTSVCACPSTHTRAKRGANLESKWARVFRLHEADTEKANWLATKQVRHFACGRMLPSIAHLFLSSEYSR